MNVANGAKNRKIAIAYGKLIFNDDNFSIGDFSLKYANILKLEKFENFFNRIYDREGNVYKFYTGSFAALTVKKFRDKVFFQF